MLRIGVFQSRTAPEGDAPASNPESRDSQVRNCALAHRPGMTATTVGIWIAARECNNVTIHMTRISVILPALIGAILSTASARADGAAFGPPPGAELSVEKLARIDDFINGAVEAGRIPGVIVLIQQHGQPVYFKCFGKRDTGTGAPMTADAIFPIHSVTKTITSVAALMLVDRGKIALDDPVSKYIPSFAGMKVGVERQDLNGKDLNGKDSTGTEDGGKRVLDLVPLRRPITVEDLLLQTSGITYGFYGQGLVKAAYDGIYLGDFDNAEFAERIAKVPLAEQPRTLWDYGHSADILGRVVEVASGQSLYRFEKDNLLDPLGMTTTRFFLTDPAERARYAAPLPRDRHVERNSLDVTRWESGGGGMVSTIADFARYGQMLLNGGTLDGRTYLKATTFAALASDHIGPGTGVARNFYYYPGDGFGYGYGFGIRTNPGVNLPTPPGSLGEIKWDSASGVYIVVDRTEDMFFVVMQNSPSWRVPVITTVKKIIYDSFEK
jgi:CubicO group peptidase (beta-lactamase class C family)